jgi:hypothetical protein
LSPYGPSATPTSQPAFLGASEDRLWSCDATSRFLVAPAVILHGTGPGVRPGAASARYPMKVVVSVPTASSSISGGSAEDQAADDEAGDADQRP